MNERKKQTSPAGHALRTFLLILVGFLVYAYSVQALDIDLEEPLDARRQDNTADVLRKLAQPDIFTFNEEASSINATIRMPCPAEPKASQVSLEGRTVILSPNCASTTQDPLTLTGTGFRPNTDGLVRWYPPGEGATTRAMAGFRSDDQGNFSVQFTMVDVRESAEPQRLEIEQRWRTGVSGFSEASQVAFERIIETVLIALMASTVGTILAVPISFLAARNLMVNVTSPLAAVMGAIVLLPVGGWIGGQASSWLVGLAGQMSAQTWMGVGALAVTGALIWPVMRLGSSIVSREGPATATRLLSLLRLIVLAVLLFLGLAILAYLGLAFGSWLDGRLGVFNFIGNFFYVASDFGRLTLPSLMALAGALVAASLGSRYGQEAILRIGDLPARLLTLVLSGLGTAIVIYGLGMALNWFYEFDNLAAWTTIPAAIGGVVAAAASLLQAPKRPFAIGFIIYNVSRTILNALRSIEPLIMGIIFVVWVGIGPFAGVLALTLHSIAALGKLFSEQVESINEGPIEAITATGANRIQTIVYAVVPQIIPPYIAFTFYRWDINVRMSTIIGFVGGGGIGFVLQQNINLLRYRQASVMMLAIAIVVSILDYVSSRLRSRFV
ncbi:MAG: ABC transporter permease subunit [Chloroflexota bacterium]